MSGESDSEMNTEETDTHEQDNGYTSTYTLEFGIARLDNSYLNHHMQCAKSVKNPNSSQTSKDSLLDISVNDVFSEFENTCEGKFKPEPIFNECESEKCNALNKSVSSEEIFASSDSEQSDGAQSISSTEYDVSKHEKNEMRTGNTSLTSVQYNVTVDKNGDIVSSTKDGSLKDDTNSSYITVQYDMTSVDEGGYRFLTTEESKDNMEIPKSFTEQNTMQFGVNPADDSISDMLDTPPPQTCTSYTSVTLRINNTSLGKNSHIQQELEVDKQEVEVENQEVEVDNQEVEVDNQEVNVDNQEVRLENQEIEVDSQEVEVDNQELEKDNQEVEVDKQEESSSEAIHTLSEKPISFKTETVIFREETVPGKEFISSLPVPVSPKKEAQPSREKLNAAHDFSKKGLNLKSEGDNNSYHHENVKNNDETIDHKKSEIFESDLDQIPSNLVRRLSRQFSKSLGDLRVVPKPNYILFTGKKTSNSISTPTKEEERGPKGEKTTTIKKEETKTEESSSGKKTTVVTTTTKTTTVVQNGDITNGPHDSKENEETEVRSGTQKPTVQEEIMSVEGGVYENEPVREPGVARESDKNIGEELPEVGMAKNILQKFTQIQEEAAKPVVGKRGATPPRGTGPVEYVSEPRTVIEKPEQKIEGGIFENQPSVEEGVVKSYEVIEDVKPEQGYARNVLAKFKEIESKVEHMPPPSPKKELTPDRFTKGEYVSEPRTVFEKYEGKTESGIFESQPQDVGDIVKSGQHEEEVLPEHGTAKNLVSKFKQYETQAKSPPMPHQKKELTPDRNTKGEYVSEPRSTFQQYESQPESGIYESKPEDHPEIVKSGDYFEEPLPEEGYAKNVISKFKTIQEGSSPVPSPSRPREITPPRQDTFSGILESTPQERPDIVKSYEVHETSAELPESGMARNILNKFKEIQQSGSNSPVSPRHKKEFTPPPQSGVYENTPQPSIVPEQRPPESGILESSPEQREGVAREGDLSAGTVEFPERGYAKNMVSKWKQIETESKSSSPSPRYKEFTPPRDEPRISSAKSPLSPKSPAGANSSVHPRDLPGQYQEQVQPGIYENQPDFREDLAREEDTDWGQGLPKEGTSKSLINKFKHVQEDAKKAMETPPPISRRGKNVQHE